MCQPCQSTMSKKKKEKLNICVSNTPQFLPWNDILPKLDKCSGIIKYNLRLETAFLQDRTVISVSVDCDCKQH